MKKPSLISPYVGGKGGSRYQHTVAGHTVSRICDRPYFYDCIVEPFAGSGATIWQHDHGITNAIAADTDPGVQAVWECWKESPESVIKVCERWHKEIYTGSPKRAFNKLKFIYEKKGFHGSLRFGLDSVRRYELAAAYLTLKRLVFGGTIRTAKTTGKLNVALSHNPSAKTKSKLDRFLDGYQYEWPDNGIETLTFKHSWQSAVKSFADSAYKRALVVIDPPYYSDKEWVEERKDGQKRVSKMTPAYGGHNPQSDDEFNMCIDCLDAVLATGKAARVVVFNYHSERLENAIDELYGKHDLNLPYFASNLGPLGNMNNAQKFHGRDDEWVWEIGGKRMFQDYDAVRQGNLLETLAA
jgi:site-specific DNA-adenine methylase